MHQNNEIILRKKKSKCFAANVKLTNWKKKIASNLTISSWRKTLLSVNSHQSFQYALGDIYKVLFLSSAILQCGRLDYQRKSNDLILQVLITFFFFPLCRDGCRRSYLERGPPSLYFFFSPYILWAGAVGILSSL